MNSELSQQLKHYRLNLDEYNQITQLLNRPPQGIEWALFSALWSEHCSYKSSKAHLRKLYSQSKRVVQSMGENAGIIDLGQGERVAFKMESHNHPSFIEPYQGAATGVGGILRDIFTMGARPIALANYLCFGELNSPRMKQLVDGVVRGIGGYGNCVGVPAITGQTEFHSSYNGNILVNAFALGLFRPNEKPFFAKAKGDGNFVVYVGAKTGRDGIHGASMASESFGENDVAKKPTVQIGDPFFEKLLIESCLEVMQKNMVVAIQDMGAAGLTSSSFEMAARGGVGLQLHLDKVPLREQSLTPEDILLSESQERMLLICEPKRFEEIKAVFDRWNLDASVIGKVTTDRHIQLFWHNEKIADIDPALLVDHAPVYDRPHKTWDSPRQVPKIEMITRLSLESGQALLNLIGDYRACSREWIHEQYDQNVGARTVQDCRESVGVLELPDSHRGLGIVLGCRPHIMRLDAKLGGMDAVLYPALELAAKGFEALAVTDCLNYGNPEKIETMTEFATSVRSMSEMCQWLDTPIISGNVSFYNETKNQNITPTPSTGVVGLRDSVQDVPSNVFTQAGNTVWCVSWKGYVCEGYAMEVIKGIQHFYGSVDPWVSSSFVRFVRELTNLAKPKSVRVVGKFGLAYALARMCVGRDRQSSKGGFGLVVTDEASRHFTQQGWLTERLYEVIYTANDEAAFEKILNQQLAAHPEVKELVQVHKLGVVQGKKLKLNEQVEVSIASLQDQYFGPSKKEKRFATFLA